MRSALLGAAAAGALFLSTAMAGAQTSHPPTESWRQADRGDKLSQQGSSQNFAFELRFGGYTPQIDQEPALMASKPYQSIFKGGSDGYKPQLYFGLEFDYLPLRIPYLGYIGPGFSWGYTRTSTKALYSADAPSDKAGKESGETTGLTIMPMYLCGVLRIDELMRRWGIPIVPYGKLGFGFAKWSADTDNGTEVYPALPAMGGVKASGLSYGLHAALGGMLSLNFLDPRAASRLDEMTSVNHVYLFGEWMNNTGLGRPSKSMYVGSSSWVVGLALDM